MIRRSLTLAVALAAATFGGLPAVQAATIDGLAAMHDIRRERGKLCMTDHWHYGNSGGHTSKKMALREAIISWQEFTALEYGNHWASYRRAGSRKSDCKRSSGGYWGCEVEARPCTK